MSCTSTALNVKHMYRNLFGLELDHKSKDGFSAGAPNEIIYVPFFKNLESIVQNDIQAQVLRFYNNKDQKLILTMFTSIIWPT